MDSFALPAPKQKSVKSNESEPPISEKKSAEFKVPAALTPSEASTDSSSSDSAPTIPPLNYQKPDWSGLPTRSYHFDVIKGGLLIETFEVTTEKEFIVVGRLPFCDVSLEHPSVSRYHAIIQFQNNGEIFLYDLKSAQGTRVNKQSLPPRKYHRIRVGDQIRFGQSTRLFVLQGLEEDTLAESEHLIHDGEISTNSANRELHGGGIEEEEVFPSDDSKYIEDENIFYRKDPKKALKNFLENQGEEMEFEVEEEGTGEERMYLVRVKLPLFETDTYGIGQDSKRKDAEKLAALDACIRLDRMGILRNSNESELAKRKNHMKELLGDDDSDDDSFFDRTGAAEKSKQKKAQKKSSETVQTYESLCEKKSELQAKIDSLANKISEGIVQTENLAKKAQAEEDDLDEYMASLDRDIKGSNISVLKRQLQGMEMEMQKLDKLIEITKPTDIFASLSASTDKAVRNTQGNGLDKAPYSDITELKPAVQAPTGASASKPSIPKKTDIQPSEPAFPESEGVELPPPDKAPESVQSKRPNSDNTTVPSKRRQFGVPTREEYEAKDKEAEVAQEIEAEEDVTWQPPEGQTGDGKTALNAKYGY
ncbi:hypothetical protein K493DRAFT_359887 [Basidiobolus meristosporus CBS 931.73]|uniref:SMAD/FHA domain-containing protein n=1 Tax=Basidiobolus meristosporus CBS 931.73 TaxID=1314790 RepID=A0A1Y1XNY0_9FUNG|nr:hypothetical protein K493DRAFT_359887 [Basidiobolus meristosporus CBS 931.73]|eukprot:ORX87433.1 hypothetical protein K493DRAFT_359887 [Basidiobolus meristosporus CBS 931.73]